MDVNQAMAVDIDQDVVVGVNQAMVVDVNQDMVVDVNQAMVVDVNQDVVVNVKQAMFVDVNQDMVVDKSQDRVVDVKPDVVVEFGCKPECGCGSAQVLKKLNHMEIQQSNEGDVECGMWMRIKGLNPWTIFTCKEWLEVEQVSLNTQGSGSCSSTSKYVLNGTGRCTDRNMRLRPEWYLPWLSLGEVTSKHSLVNRIEYGKFNNR